MMVYFGLEKVGLGNNSIPVDCFGLGDDSVDDFVDESFERSSPDFALRAGFCSDSMSRFCSLCLGRAFRCANSPNGLIGP